MNKNIPYFVLKFFFSFFPELPFSHHPRCSRAGTRKDITGKWRSPGFAPRFRWGARVSPRPLVLSGPGDGRVAGTGLGQDMCGQLDGEGEQAVPLAATPKPAGIIYGADFLQVVLQGWGGRGRPRHWGKGVRLRHPTTQESRASQGVWRWYRSDLKMSFKKNTLVFSSHVFCFFFFSMQTNLPFLWCKDKAGLTPPAAAAISPMLFFRAFWGPA